MIRVLVVDDHPAVRTGLRTLLGAEPGIVPVAAVESGAAAVKAASVEGPDVALIDFHLPDMNGVALASDLGQSPHPPALLLYSANADPRVALAAYLAGIQAVLSKSIDADTLYDAIREAARREASPAAPTLLHSARGHVRLDDLPLLGMACDGTDAREIANVLGREPNEIERRLAEIATELAEAADRGPEPAITAR